jgi:hypothetical protein
MAFFIKTTEGLERLNGMQIKSSTAEKTITANGTYNASSDGVDGYSTVMVDVPSRIDTSYLPSSDASKIVVSNAPDALGIHTINERYSMPLAGADTDVTCYGVLKSISDYREMILMCVPYASSEGDNPAYYLAGGGDVSTVQGTVYGNNTFITGVDCTAWHVYTLAINNTTKKVRYFVDGEYKFEKTFSHSGDSVVLGAGDVNGSSYAERPLYCRYAGAVAEFESDEAIIANQLAIMEKVDMT